MEATASDFLRRARDTLRSSPVKIFFQFAGAEGGRAMLLEPQDASPNGKNVSRGRFAVSRGTTTTAQLFSQRRAKAHTEWRRPPSTSRGK